MLCEDLVKTQNEELSLSVTVRVADLDMPRSEEQLRDALLAHALDCHECLTVVLFQEESLSECGCDTYRQLFCEATEELMRQNPIDSRAHLSEQVLENFFLDRLSDDQVNSIAEHVETCHECWALVQQRQAFYLCVKDAVRDQKEGRTKAPGLTRVLGITAPEVGLHLCSRTHQ